MDVPAHLVLAAVVVVAVGPVAVDAARTDDARLDAASSDDCFSADGHSMTVGTEGPHLNVTVHTSLFSDLGAPGVVGLEATGVALDQSIVVLRTGVRFEGVGDAAAFVSDPFSRVSVVHHYEFRLPMFDSHTDGDFDYESDQSPVSGVNATAC